MPPTPELAGSPTRRSEPAHPADPADPAGRPGARSRDPLIDLVRAVAITGVVAGHWLITVLLPVGGVLTPVSPLPAHPGLTPLSWLLQTLGLFFLVGGFAAARSRRGVASVGRLVGRLVTPVLTVVGAWAAVLAVLLVRGVAGTTIGAIANVVIDPLWFLAVYIGLSAVTPLLPRRIPVLLRAAAGTAALTVALELAVLLGAPPVIGWPRLITAWATPWLLGAALAAGWRPRPATGGALAVAGVLAVAAGVLLLGDPASAVGVPAAGRSNLAPPSVVTLGLAAAQCGLVLVAAGPLRRWCARRRVAAAGRWIGDAALPIFLLHQTALLLVTLPVAALAPAGVPAGLLGGPGQPGWLPARLLWLPAFAAVLAALIALAPRRLRTGPARSGRSGRPTGTIGRTVGAGRGPSGPGRECGVRGGEPEGLA
jgi:hypothetical protein